MGFQHMVKKQHQFFNLVHVIYQRTSELSIFLEDINDEKGYGSIFSICQKIKEIKYDLLKFYEYHFVFKNLSV